jgi:hypothetical protein
MDEINFEKFREEILTKVPGAKSAQGPPAI